MRVGLLPAFLPLARAPLALDRGRGYNGSMSLAFLGSCRAVSGALAVCWIAAAGTGAPLAAAEPTRHCEAAAEVVAEHETHGDAHDPAAVSPAGTANVGEGCPDCAGNEGCSGLVPCAPAGPVALLASAPAIDAAPGARLREGWRIDRPLSRNPTPPTPPPPSAL